MKCAQHPEVESAYYCSNCGLSLCSECTQNKAGRILCAQCAPGFEEKKEGLAEEKAHPPPPPPQVVPEPSPLPNLEKGDPYCSPGVAFALGLVPGVGAICNGELMKGFIHVLIFGSLISLSDSNQVAGLNPLFGIMAGAFYLYMPLEAYHTARKRTLALRGIQIITPFERMKFSSLWTGLLAAALGGLFLVNQFVPDAIAFVMRGWPIILILIGLYNLARHFGLNPLQKKA
jgi:hypothetical protein